MDSRIDPLDQVQLPEQPLDLPDTKAHEQDSETEANGDKQSPFPRRWCHRLLLASADIIPGIMFVLRWYMIHSEPAIVIRTITPVKT